MISLEKSYSLTDLFSARQKNFGFFKRYLYGFCAFAILMALLEFGQDYISSLLNENYFHPVESLSYKFFWLLFIPFSIMQLYLLEKTGHRYSSAAYFAFNILFISAITLAHLIIFSLFLFGISTLIHENPWSLSILITEKLSTRLYIGLSIYIAFPAVYVLLTQLKKGKDLSRQKYHSTIPVKNGQITEHVDVRKIRWIRSDGPYLDIQTNDKKYVILDSLKNILTNLPANFKRIHRSTIVNIDYIQKLRSRGNGDYDVILNDGWKLRLSRNYARPLKGSLL